MTYEQEQDEAFKALMLAHNAVIMVALKRLLGDQPKEPGNDICAALVSLAAEARNAGEQMMQGIDASRKKRELDRQYQ